MHKISHNYALQVRGTVLRCDPGAEGHVITGMSVETRAIESPHID